jgi:hypothetical protein
MVTSGMITVLLAGCSIRTVCVNSMAYLQRLGVKAVVVINLDARGECKQMLNTCREPAADVAVHHDHLLHSI